MGSHEKKEPKEGDSSKLTDADKRLIDFLVQRAIKRAVTSCS
jgi:hypothetical protein